MSRLHLLLCLILAAPLAFGERPPDLGRAAYYRPPQLTVMVGFIKDPQHAHYSVAEWAKGIGAKFDAKSLVDRARRAGVVQIIWYDKWIDGLVFRKTKTTAYQTERDFLAELAPECRRQRIKLVIYFNTFFDDNPEFAEWATTDQRAKPVVFAPFWPARLFSMYSPFREKALEQIRELLVNYNVDGLWLDVPRAPLMPYDGWTREAFRKRFGKEPLDASPAERSRFAVDSTWNWNREVAAFARKLKPDTLVTTNNVPDPLASSPASAIAAAEPLDFFTAELHTSEIQQRQGPSLGETSKPFEGGTLISDDWFTPLNAGPPKTSKSADQMHVELANLFTAGLNCYLAITLGHDGTLHEGTLQLLDFAGDWVRARRPYLGGAEDAADVGIVLGTADPADYVWPGGTSSYSDEMLTLEARLRSSGYMCRRLLASAHSRIWDAIPAGMRTLIVPDRVSLTPWDARRVEDFVRGGGKLLSFGRGVSLAKSGEPQAPAPVFGVRSAGYLTASGRTSLEVELDKKTTTIRGPMLHFHAVPPNVLLWAVTTEGEMPFLTRNPAGKGVVYAIATSESALFDAPKLLDHLWNETIGQPSWKIEEAPGRYAVRIRRQKDRFIVHVIDNLTSREGPMQRFRPAYATLQLNAQRVPFREARVVPDNRPLKISTRGTWAGIQLYPDPELTIVLE